MNILSDSTYEEGEQKLSSLSESSTVSEVNSGRKEEGRKEGRKKKRKSIREDGPGNRERKERNRG